MHVLTFDIEEWYNCDFITPDFNWDKYEVRIYSGIERILTELESRNQKATFFCLGWIAEKHLQVIRDIHAAGHHIGCHSYQHELSFRFDRQGFKNDTEKSKKLIEDLIGEKINAFRAPGFSITEKNIWALEVLSELGFEYDCSLFPAAHDYGGFESYGKAEPTILHLPNGAQIKEFPINIHKIASKSIVFSGGGFFRLFPYFLIKRWVKQTDYVMTYFHTRDFDPDQPMIETLPLMRKFKSYVGLKTSFKKFQHLLDDFEFVNLLDADKLVDWTQMRTLKL
ncbi:MAG: polysaccharide deacetylase family protein [Prevotellaceae bacterium]|jgi:polysaccharide deacetylase family protein (PEP-CTERM system associated)|nr:polysaccharide deacetylase family protein [Prevotellaceae bacterium]